MSWQGPFEVLEKMGDYRIQVPGQGRCLYHATLLNGWQECEDPGLYSAEVDWDEEGRARSWELQPQVASGEPARPGSFTKSDRY